MNEAFSLVKELKDTVLFHNRYFVSSHKVLDLLLKRINKHDSIINSNTILYRARKMNAIDINNIPELANSFYEGFCRSRDPFFKGYGPEDCMQPRKENANGGRTNPNLFAYLYTSRSPITTIYEVKPNLEDVISIATLKVLQDIKNADISLESMIMDDYKALEDFVTLFIGLEFSRVCNNTDKDYIFTQYIAEFCKYNGFDALEFNSSLHKACK